MTVVLLAAMVFQSPIAWAADEKSETLTNAKLVEKKHAILPLFHKNRDGYIDVMRHCISLNASFFNTHRMIQQYVLKAYLT